MIATSALALILVIILAIVLVTRNTGASKDDLAKAAQQATDQAQAAQDAKDQKAAAEKAVAAADKAAADAATTRPYQYLYGYPYYSTAAIIAHRREHQAAGHTFSLMPSTICRLLMPPRTMRGSSQGKDCGS